MKSRRSLTISGLLAVTLGVAAAEPLPDPLAAGWEGEPVCELVHDGLMRRVSRFNSMLEQAGFQGVILP